MPDLSVNRTLAKSPPELWSEFSEVERLANHLGEFGEITISRLEREHTVAWEGELAFGTVELQASGEGTEVTINVEVREMEAANAPAPVMAPTVHQVIPDLEAWDRSAARIEFQAGWQTSAAQRSAARAAERAERKPKGGLPRRLFRGRRAESGPTPARPGKLLEPSARTDPGGELQAPRSQSPQRPTQERTNDTPRPRPAPEAGPVGEPRDHKPVGRRAAAVDQERALAVLQTALDDIGTAPHRSFPRN